MTRRAAIGGSALLLAASACASDDDAAIVETADTGEVTSDPTTNSTQASTTEARPVADDSTQPSTTSTPPSTTEPDTTTTTEVAASEDEQEPTDDGGAAPSTTVPDADAPSLALIDLDLAQLGSTEPSTAPSAGELPAITTVTDALGDPTNDTGWRAMPPKLICTGSDEYREFNWGDLRLVVERDLDTLVTFVGAWSVGTGQPISPTRSVPLDELEPSGVSTIDGVGIGDSVDDLPVIENGGDIGDGRYVVPGARALIVEYSDDRSITGIFTGRNDCFGAQISNVPCDSPIPVYTLPNGDPTGNLTTDDGFASWSTSSDGEPVDIDISEELGGVDGSDDLVQIGFQSIAAGNGIASGPLQIAVVPIADPPVGGAALVLFDERTDCIRQFFVGTDADGLGLDLDELRSYATTLANTWDVRL